jgi:hypothetical protein
VLAVEVTAQTGMGDPAGLERQTLVGAGVALRMKVEAMEVQA